MGRAYGFRGTREEKLRTLHALSGSDYYTVPKRELPDRFSCKTDEGTVKGVANPEMAYDHGSGFWTELLEILSKEIPPQVRWLLGSTIRTPVPVSEDPLCVITTLLENEHGVMVPQILPFESCKDSDKPMTFPENPTQEEVAKKPSLPNFHTTPVAHPHPLHLNPALRKPQ